MLPSSCGRRKGGPRQGSSRHTARGQLAISAPRCLGWMFDRALARRKEGKRGGNGVTAVGEGEERTGPGLVSNYTTPRLSPPKHVRCSCGPVCFSQTAAAAPPLLTVRVGSSFFLILFFFLTLFNKSFSILSALVPDVHLAGEHENSWQKALGGKTRERKTEKLKWEILDLVKVGGGWGGQRFQDPVEEWKVQILILGHLCQRWSSCH